MPVDDLIAAAYYGGAGSTTSYAQATGGLPPESQVQAVLAALATFSLDGTDGSGGVGPAATTTAVPAADARAPRLLATSGPPSSPSPKTSWACPRVGRGRLRWSHQWPGRWLGRGL